MMRTAALLLALLCTGACAQGDSDPAGRWRLTLDTGAAQHSGILEIERSEDGYLAWVDGGPIQFMLDDDTVSMQIDTRDGGGRLLAYALNGSLADDAFEGILQPPLDAAPGTWTAVREATPATQPPMPVDFSGIWARTSSGIAKVHLDYKPAAQARVDDYDYIDDPALRCVSPGLVRVSGWPYPLEIVQNDTQVTILYESFHEVRRIFLDGRAMPEDMPARFMGYSIGRFEGSTLVVETDLLLPGLVDLHGQPLSENARVVERMSLSEDGQQMFSEMTIHDPDFYNRPITRFRSWRRSPETDILEYDCDAYPFFRGLEIEGRLQEYWQRMRRR